jgi:hypothetical protein
MSSFATWCETKPTPPSIVYVFSKQRVEGGRGHRVTEKKKNSPSGSVFSVFPTENAMLRLHLASTPAGGAATACDHIGQMNDVGLDVKLHG